MNSLLPDAAPSEELIRAVVSMRDKKSPEEIAEIEKACAVGYEMHTTAMRICRPGATEREIAGAIEGVALQGGAGGSLGARRIPVTTGEVEAAIAHLL